MKIAFIVLLSFCFFPSFTQEVDRIELKEGLPFQNLFSANIQPEVACFRIPSLVTATKVDIGLFFEKDENPKNVFVRHPMNWLNL